MITYEISRLEPGTRLALSRVTYRRRDHARSAFLNAVYDMIADNGGLDTEYGWTAWRAARNCSVCSFYPPPAGQMREVVIPLHSPGAGERPARPLVLLIIERTK